jgi:hypothetical protein
MAALVLALAIFVSAVRQAAVADLVGGEYRSELTGDVALCHTAPPRPALSPLTKTESHLRATPGLPPTRDIL